MRLALALLAATAVLAGGCGSAATGGDRERPGEPAATTQEQGSGGGYVYP